MAKKAALFKPGQEVPDSGQYEIVGSRGGKKNHGERTISEDETFPPTPEPGLRYKLVDRTKHPRK